MTYSATSRFDATRLHYCALRDRFVNILILVEAVGRGHHDGRIIRSHGAICFRGRRNDGERSTSGCEGAASARGPEVLHHHQRGGCFDAVGLLAGHLAERRRADAEKSGTL